MVARKITGVRMTDWGCMLRAYRRTVVERMIDCHEHATFIPALATHFGKRVTEIEVAHEERHGGKSNYPLRKLINLQFDLVASFSELPIKLIMYGGVLLAILGVCFGAFLVVARLALRGRLGGAGGVHPVCDPVRLCGAAVFCPRPDRRVYRPDLPRGPQATRICDRACLWRRFSFGRRGCMRVVVFAYHNMGIAGLNALERAGYRDCLHFFP